MHFRVYRFFRAARLSPHSISHVSASPSISSLSKLPRTCTRVSLGPDEIYEYASVVVPQVGQFVGEVGEVVADASLQVLGDVMVDRGQDAAAGVDLDPGGQAVAPRPGCPIA